MSVSMCSSFEMGVKLSKWGVAFGGNRHRFFSVSDPSSAACRATSRVQWCLEHVLGAGGTVSGGDGSKVG